VRAVELLERARWLSWRRQRLHRPRGPAEEALRDVVAVYSSHPSGPLTLLARVASLAAPDFRRLDTERLAMRVPAMRRSIFLAPQDTAPRLFAASSRGPALQASYMRGLGIDETEYAGLADQLVAVCDEPRAASELSAHIGVKGEGLRVVVSAVCREGRLVRVADGDSLRGNRLRYVRPREPLTAGGQTQARAWLAGEYLRAFGPATAGDFAWWAGLDGQAAAAALGAHDTLDVGDGLLLRAEDKAALARVKPAPGSLALLPKWDAWTMGYAPAGRGRFLPEELRPVAYEDSGDARPVIVVDGQVAGGWTMRFRGDVAEIELRPAETPGPQLAAALRERAEEAAGLLGASRVAFG
jgi:hypothetical protein